MTLKAIRILRGSLLIVVLGVIGWVASLLREPLPGEAGPAPAPTAAAPGVPRLDRLRFVKLEQGEESFVLEAERSVGDQREGMHLEGIKARFGYRAQGGSDRSTVTADRCVYQPARQKAVFEGRVLVVTDNGLRVRTSSLTYVGERSLARSSGPTEFESGRLSGSSKDLVYDAERGRVTLPAEVRMLIADEAGGVTQIDSGRAEVLRSEGTVEFLDGVEVLQGADRITAGKLRLRFSPEQVIQRAQFLQGVDLRARGGGGASGLPGGGERHLTCLRLDLGFRPTGSLESAFAGPEAELTLGPAPGGPAEVRRLRGHFLGFRYDEAARLEQVHGYSGAEMESQRLPPGHGPTQAMRCRKFVAYLNPLTGALDRADLRGDVWLDRGPQQAGAQQAFFSAGETVLKLEKGSHVYDAGRGVELTADKIDLFTLTGDVAARGQTRSVYRDRAGLGLVGSGGTPVVVVAPQLDYRAQTRTADYRGGALLRSGEDEIRGERIQVREEAEGRRTLAADGHVVSRMQPHAGDVETGRAAVVESQAEHLVYDESQGEAVFTGEVSIRQGDITTRSPRATLTLKPNGAGIERLVAGEPVEVRQGGRTARGRLGTYTPADQTMVLVGDRVSLEDATQRIEGRALTFRVGDDRVLVDGADETRTRTILRKGPAGP